MYSERAYQFFIPTRTEQIDPVQMSQRFGQTTFFQTSGDDEHLIVWKEIRFFERKFEFFMAVTMLFVEVVRKTSDDHIAFEDGFPNFTLPRLPGLQPFRIEPDLEPVLDQALVQPVDDFPVAVCVDEEDVRFVF